MSPKKPKRPRDPFENDEWKAYADRFRRRVLPKIAVSAQVMAISPAGGDANDIQFMLQIGAAVVLDKPIVLLVPPGWPIPPRLARVADKIIEMDISTEAGQADAQRKLLEYLRQ